MNTITKVVGALAAVILLVAIAYTGVQYLQLEYVFGVVIPYAGFTIFIGGFIKKILYWSRSPVPFNITTTAGQQKSLDWIRHNQLENPSTTIGVTGRMLMEVLFFRSLFRNTKAGLSENNRPGYASEKSLWLAGLLFHWSFLYIVIRHLRFFISPVPGLVISLEKFDSMFQVGLPIFYLTDAIFVLAVTFLFLRRIIIPQVKYISLTADYFPLFVILAIGFTGMLMRYYSRVDVAGIKHLTMGLVSFQPVIPENLSPVFFIHLFLVCVLITYFPFSKLMHMGGVFFSPTRNLKGNSRQLRHNNPWNYPVKVHSYEEYEEEYKTVMKGAGLPVEKE